MEQIHADYFRVIHRVLAVLFAVGLASAELQAQNQPSVSTGSIQTIPGMPLVVDPRNVYSEIRADNLSPAVAGALPRVYVPNRQSNDVAVIDPATFKVVDRFGVGVNPQHAIPFWDLKTPLGQQQRGRTQRRQRDAHRSENRQAREIDSGG